MNTRNQTRIKATDLPNVISTLNRSQLQSLYYDLLVQSKEIPCHASLPRQEVPSVGPLQRTIPLPFAG
jgi:hypothetical protein